MLAAIQCFGANFIQQHGDRSNLWRNPDVVQFPSSSSSSCLTLVGVQTVGVIPSPSVLEVNYVVDCNIIPIKKQNKKKQEATKIMQTRPTCFPVIFNVFYNNNVLNLTFQHFPLGPIPFFWLVFFFISTSLSASSFNPSLEPSLPSYSPCHSLSPQCMPHSPEII